MGLADLLPGSQKAREKVDLAVYVTEEGLKT